MLTQKDIVVVETIVRKEVSEKTRLLPTKEDFYSMMDKVMGELRSIREEITILVGRQAQHSDQLEDHETRILQLEKN